MSRTSLAVCLLAVALLISVAAPARCGDVYWNNASGGSFSVGSNWNPTTAPGATDVAWFLPSTSFDVVFDTSPTNQYLVYNYSTPNSNAVRFISAAGGTQTYHLTSSGGLWWNAGGVNVNSGNLIFGAPTQPINVLADEAISVGGSGTLKVFYGSHASGRNFFITALNGNHGLGSAVVDGSGSQLTTTGGGYINYVGDGSGSNAYLAIQNNALGRFQTDLAVGTNGATGHLTVQTGGSLSVTNNLTLGTAYSAGDGAGAMTVASGAHVAVGHDLTLWNTVLGANAISLTGGTVNVTDVFQVGGNTGGSSTATASVTGGSLSVANPGHTAAINVREGGILTLNGGVIQTDALNVDATGQFNNVSGSLLFTGQSAVNTGTLNLSGGTATAGDNLAIGSAAGASGQINISNGATLQVLSGVLGVGNNGTLTGGSGGGTLTVGNGKVDAHTILLGSTTGGSGTMFVHSLANVSVHGGISVNDLVIDGGTLTVSAESPLPGDDPVISQTIVGGYQRNGAIAVSGGSVTAPNIKLGVTVGCAGAMNISGGSVTAGNVYVGGSESASGGTGTVTVSGGQLSVNGSLTLWNSGSSIIVHDGGTLTTDTLNGPAGTTINISDPVGGVVLTVGSAANGNFAGTIANGLAGPGSVRKVGEGTQTFSGDSLYTGTTTIDVGTLEVRDHPLASPAIAVNSNAILRYSTSGAITQGTTLLTGGGRLVKSGAGTATFGGAGSTIVWALGSGAVIDVQEGSLAVGAADHAEDWSANLASLNIAAGAVFVSTAANIGIDALTGGGTLTGGYPDYGYLNAAIGVNNGSGTFSGVIQDHLAPLNLVKRGSGTLRLTGANIYTGLTSVSAGTLELGPNARDPVLTLGGGADILGGKLVFDYAGTTILSIIRTAVNSGVISRPSTNPPLICLDNLSNAVTVESTLYGDADVNGVVNGADLNTVLSNYNQTGMGWSQGDFDGNGTVNGSDLNTLLSNYNRSVDVGAAVPEPSTLVLLGIGAVSLLAYAWRRR